MKEMTGEIREDVSYRDAPNEKETIRASCRMRQFKLLLYYCLNLELFSV